VINWRRARVADFCVTGTGGTPARHLAERYYEGGTIPWVKSGELRENIICDTDEHITQCALAESNLKKVPSGALLLAMYGATVGRLAILGVPATTNQAICHIIPDPRVAQVRYLFYALRNQVASIIRRGVGGAQPNISQGIVKSLEVPIPPLTEQQRIVDILDKADALRAKRLAALAQLDVLTHSIFFDMFGDPATNPKLWPVEALDTVATTTSGGTPNRSMGEYFGGGIPWVKSGELHQGVVTATEESLTERGLAESSAKLMPPGTVLVAMYGATVGAVAVLGVTAATNQAVCCMQPSKELDTCYLVNFLRLSSPSLLAKRVGGAQPNLSQDLLRRLKVAVPPLELQVEFARRISKVAILQATCDASLTQLNTLFSALAHLAFRGEL
jgi:type I restriction enzyme, S subunit